MADTTDTGGWARYPTMTPPAEAESPAAPSDAGRYPSMPGGRAVDASPRRVPRHPPATSAPAAATADDAEAARLRARYPTMAEAGIRPTEADAAPATEGEPTAQDPVPSSAAPAEATLPETYRDLAVEGFDVDAAALATVAPDLQRLGVSREQAAGLVQVYAKLEAETDRQIEATAAAWRAEAQRLPQAELTAARGVLKDAPAELQRVIEASGVGNHAPTIQWLARLRAGGTVRSADDRLADRYPSMRNWR
jgi:hypothetical protein